MGDSTSKSTACAEYARLSRRSFLQTAGAGAAVASLSPRLALADPGRGGAGQRDVLITVFCRGGLDGLSAVVPFGDPDYAAGRGSLAVPPPSAGQGAVDLDGFFGLSPSAAPLLTPYADGRLLPIHASGSTFQTLSHFFGMQRWETGTAPSTPLPLSSGWVARHLVAVPPVGSGEFRAMSVTPLLPATLGGAPGALPIPMPSGYVFPGDSGTVAARRAVLEDVHVGSASPVAPAALSALTALDELQGVDFAGYSPAGGASYPGGSFGSGLRSVAAALKAGIPLEACEVDYGGWDHHVDLGPLNGQFASMMDVFARSLEAFYLDLRGSGINYTLVAQSEFGRRIEPNLGDGIDHGYGNVMFLMGEGIAGGRVLANWPGLAPANLVLGNLDVTIDYRDVLAEVADRRLGNPNVAAIFPGLVPTVHGVTV